MNRTKLVRTIIAAVILVVLAAAAAILVANKAETPLDSPSIFVH